MAEKEDRSGEDLTEEASPHRLEEYRSKGMVAQSREVTGLLALLAAAAATYALSPKMGAEMAGFMREVFQTDLSARADLGSTQTAQALFIKAIRLISLLSLPICVAGFVMGVVGSFAQIGSIFSFEPISPSFDKINPLSGLQRMFSGRQWLDGLRITVKLIVLSLVAYSLLKSEMLQAPAFMGVEAPAMLSEYGRAAKAIFLSLFLVLTVFAAGDFWMQRREYDKQLRMTKQEAKQEHREREGDPMIKARIRSVQREMARRRMMDAVKTADVVVTNPTHFAVALKYDRQTMGAPKVVAKGADLVAQRIKKIAAEAGIPLVENVPLARTLYKTVKVNQAVPKVLYQAVAEVLAYVYRLKGRGF
ncbi:MAG: flagellar biosynthesis protein FlhB [Oligoflexia bacterium]|nr:flagellar biosynthesis protein FlhB [Oligoflexia bacterium]